MKDKILGALARGYCHKDNSNKVLDDKLINAMCEEVLKIIKDLEDLTMELLTEIEDMSPCGTECLSQELLNKIETTITNQ